MKTVKSGDLAYYDSFEGLIPVKVKSIMNPGHPGSMMDVTLITTTKRGCYDRGETIQTNQLHVIPRNAVFRRNYRYMISPYNVIAD